MLSSPLLSKLLKYIKEEFRTQGGEISCECGKILLTADHTAYVGWGVIREREKIRNFQRYSQKLFVERRVGRIFHRLLGIQVFSFFIARIGAMVGVWVIAYPFSFFCEQDSVINSLWGPRQSKFHFVLLLLRLDDVWLKNVLSHVSPDCFRFRFTLSIFQTMCVVEIFYRSNFRFR